MGVRERDGKAGRVMETGSISPSHTNTSAWAERIFPGLEGQREGTARLHMTVTVCFTQKEQCAPVQTHTARQLQSACKPTTISL